jgi:hypothetical protein
MRALVVLLAFGCHGQLEPLGPAEGPGPGAPPGDAPACDDRVATAVTGEHHPGRDCMLCHAAGGDGPTFTLGGTLYADVAGTAPLDGAAVHVLAADGQEIVMETALNGNFWTTAPLAFPVTTWASACPDVRPMVTPVAAGGCNAAGCHGETFRAHVP